jgi:threonine dehydratase
MARSLAEKRPILELEAEGETLAEGLEGGVSPTTFHHVRESVERVDTVTEDEIRDAIRFSYRTLGITVEGSAAVVIAWAREHADEVPGEGAIVLVVTSFAAS